MREKRWQILESQGGGLKRKSVLSMNFSLHLALSN